MIEKDFLSKLESLKVKILDPNSTVIDKTCIIGKNTTIFPNNTIIGNTIIGQNCVIEGNNFIKDCNISENNKISFSYIVNSTIGKNNQIGPFSRLREAEILNNTRIGNFVEIKKSLIHDGVKASHLAYIGDSEIGEKTNIGCGVIFSNFNGKEKFKTIVGKNCFIGSNCNLIAPIEIEDNSFIAAGTTVYKNIKKNKFVIGNRELKIKEDLKKIHIKKDNKL